MSFTPTPSTRTTTNTGTAVNKQQKRWTAPRRTPVRLCFSLFFSLVLFLLFCMSFSSFNSFLDVQSTKACKNHICCCPLFVLFSSSFFGVFHSFPLPLALSFLSLCVSACVSACLCLSVAPVAQRNCDNEKRAGQRAERVYRRVVTQKLSV